MFQVTKTFDLGLSCAFRNWRAANHCRFLHGYAISVTTTFAADALDDTGWVINFGDLKWVKELLCARFDHHTIVAVDDPRIDWFRDAEALGLVQLTLVPAVSCEHFADQIAKEIERGMTERGVKATLRSVTVREHFANAATWIA